MNFNSKPIPDDTLIDDLKPARFLQANDLTERWKVKSLTVTISRLANEDTMPSMRDIDPKTKQPKIHVQPVLYFKDKNSNEFPRGMLISASENLTAIKAATGAKTAGELIGKRITIIVGEFKHKPVLRISPEPPAIPANGQAKPPIVQVNKLSDLQEKVKTDPIVAFAEVCKLAGIDQPTAQSILRESGGAFEDAFGKVIEQYKAVLE